MVDAAIPTVPISSRLSPADSAHRASSAPVRSPDISNGSKPESVTITHLAEIVRWLDHVTDGSRCYLATEEQVLVSSILRAYPEEFAQHLELGAARAHGGFRSRNCSTWPTAEPPTTSRTGSSSPTGHTVRAKRPERVGPSTGSPMTRQQRQARALGDPTRHSIFRYVAAKRRPVDVAELTAHVGLHHNAVRQHLARLVDAGLVEEASAPPQGRGRPRLVYTVAPNVDSRWGVVGPYEQLTVLMSEIIRSGDSSVVVGERAGRSASVDAAVASDASADSIDVLVEQMARFGFEPTATQRGDDVDVVLHVCPFETDRARRS